jgi:hypothetical protein
MEHFPCAPLFPFIFTMTDEEHNGPLIITDSPGRPEITTTLTPLQSPETQAIPIYRKQATTPVVVMSQSRKMSLLKGNMSPQSMATMTRSTSPLTAEREAEYEALKEVSKIV